MSDGVAGSRQKMGWWEGISRYFAFMGNRRLDVRFSVLPDAKRLIALLVVIALVVIGLVFLVDPIYIHWVKSPDFSKTMFWLMLTKIGASNWILIGTGLILVVQSFLTADRFTKAKNLIWHRVFMNAWYMFTTVALSGIAVLLLKLVFARARPPAAELDSVWVTGHFADTYLFGSFPSGHSTTAGALAIGFALLFPRFRLVFVAIGLSVAASRSVLGVHFPSDVFAGFTFGSLFSYYWARWFARKRLLFNFTNHGSLILRGSRKG